jgi:DNA-binding HxlR family transcriptional regulator
MSARTLVIGDNGERRQEARFQPIFGEKSKQMKARLRVLSKKYTWEIIADLMEGKKNLTQIAEEGGIPYTTVQNRVVEMEKLKLITIHDEVDKHSKRPVKMIRVEDFRFEVSGAKILELMRLERG